ncbi:MAG: ferrous iron transport protein A [Peptococcaceae bacterium]|nr:ferrous iron transport protein A [Peptococcaceae bacterium]
MKENYLLADLPKGKQGIVAQINLEGELRHRLQDLGLVENTEITCVGQSPLGDPKAYLIRGAIIALRNEESSQIVVES